jgi:hypothetical protein
MERSFSVSLGMRLEQRGEERRGDGDMI